MSAVRAMQEWCRLQCEGYSGVQIRDLSTSFRDGLAFCAMIHRHRPDLIDFDSLSKENVYENNRLAFEVAEQELGIPALLDPMDMVSMKVPDRLSIMTYVSQYYNYFRNPPPASIPHPLGLKRSAASSPSEPAMKKTTEKASTPQSEEEAAEPEPRTSLSSTCATCHRHVHLVQRYLVEGRLYHRQCFRCKECCGTLLPGSYRPGLESGTFVCTHHRSQGAAISPSMPACRQDDETGGATARTGPQGVSPLEEGRQKDDLIGIPPTTATVRVVPESSPVPEAADEGNGSPPRPTAASKSNGSVLPSGTMIERNSDRLTEDQGSLAAEMDLNVPAITTSTGTTPVPKQPSPPAKTRPQLQPKPALPSKPVSLQHQTSVPSRNEDPEVPRSAISLQDDTGAPSSQSGDPSVPHTPLSLQDQPAASTQSADPGEPHTPVSPEDQAGTSSSGSSDPGEPHIAKSPEGQPVASSSGSIDPPEQRTPGALPRAGARDSRPVPAVRRPSGATRSPQLVPVPRPRSIAPAESGSELGPFAPTQVTNGGQPGPPVPKPRARPKSSERMENGKPQKEPPWIALVQMEKRRKAAPPPPGTPPRASAEGQPASPAEDREGRAGRSKPPTQPKPYNPFEDEEEEEEANESSLTPGHPWYGITPTSSPKARKRAAPKAPSASPLARHSSLISASRTSHSEPSSSTPSPAPSIESLSSEGGSRTAGDPALSESVSKSTSEPAVCSSGIGGLAPSNGAPATLSADSSFTSGSELANHEGTAASPPSSRSSSCGSLRSSPHRPPPPKPTAPHVAAEPAHVASEPAAAEESVPAAEEHVPSPPARTQPKSSCKENPFNRKASPVVSPATRKSTKGPKPARPPAPGHGFPLVKRKVQADQYIPEEDIHGELNAIERQLDTLELRGIELEGKLRSVDSETEEDDELLVDWFRLIHEKHMLVRRESELVYVIKQQNLEQRQADVEYELRCLLNKPEKDWTEDDRAREQVLMQDLVTIIEQRNAIVTCLDEDRQREEEEDKLLAVMMKKKDFHKDAEPASVKKKGKFKPLKALKMLSSKTDSKIKSPKDKS